MVTWSLFSVDFFWFWENQVSLVAFKREKNHGKIPPRERSHIPYPSRHFSVDDFPHLPVKGGIWTNRSLLGGSSQLVSG